MNRYEQNRRRRSIVFLLIALLAAPPGAVTTVAAAENRRIYDFDRDTEALETFRNPQFSSGRYNRHLFAERPAVLLGPISHANTQASSIGYNSAAEPDTLWLTYKGRLQWKETDLSLRTAQAPLEFRRVYRGSVSDYDGPLGHRWDFSWNKHLEELPSGNVILYDMGRSEEYVWEPIGGSFLPAAGRYDTLVKTTSPNQITRTNKYDLREIYEQEDSPDDDWYRLISRGTPDNETTFSYDDDSLLTKVTDALDRDVEIDYDANSRITKITDVADREWEYDYTTIGYLETVRTPIVDEEGTEDDYLSGKTTTYKYDSGGNLTEILRPGDSSTGTWKWVYDGQTDEIVTATFGGNSYSLDYDTSNKNVTVTDPEDNDVRYSYNDDYLITKKEVFYSQTESWDTTYTYNADAELTKIVFPSGNEIEYEYDDSDDLTRINFRKSNPDIDVKRWNFTYTSTGKVKSYEDPNEMTWYYDHDSEGYITKKRWPAVTAPTGIQSTDNNDNDNDDGTIVEEWEYNGAGLVTKYIDPVGTVTKTAYTRVNGNFAFPRKVTADDVTGGLKLITTYEYDAVGNVTLVTNPENEDIVYTVNALDQVIMAVEPLSVTRKWHYDPNDRVTTIDVSNDTDVGDGWFEIEHEYDQSDNLTKIIEDVTSTTTITTTHAFDAKNRLTKTTSPEGNVTEYSYDARDLRTAMTRKALLSADDAITKTAYDDNGNVTKVTDPLGNDTTLAYDGYDRLTKVTRPEDEYVTHEYDENGNITKTQHFDANDTKVAETEFRFDEADRFYGTRKWVRKADLTTKIGDGTQSIDVWRDESGRVVDSDGELCGCDEMFHVYDAVGRRVTTKDPMGTIDASRNLVVNEYDKNGNVTKTIRKDRTQDVLIESDKDIETSFVYDARDRMISKKEKIDTSTYAETAYHYGERDQLTKVVDGEGNERRIEYNEQLWVTKEILENGTTDVVVEYEYDDDGRLLTHRAKNSDTGDQETIYAYDKLDRVVTTTWPDDEETIHTYDKASNRISTTDPNGTISVRAYDFNNRLESIDISLAPGVAVGVTDIDYEYDAMDRVTKAETDENGTFDTVVERTYNTLGLIETEKQVIDGYLSGSGRTFTYDWDIAGQKLGVTYPTANEYVSYERDKLDRVDKISRGSSELVDYKFNGDRVIAKLLPGSDAEYTYDTFGRLTQVFHEADSGDDLAKFKYGYDKAHQVTYLDKFFYDDTGARILDDTSDEGDQYAYDDTKRVVTVLRGVPTSKITTSISTNAQNEDYGEKVEYFYDQMGNRTERKVDGSADPDYDYNVASEMTDEGTTSWTYDKNGNSKSRPDETYKYAYNDQIGRYDFDDGFVSTWYEYHYDAFGRLVEREHYSNVSVRFYWDGSQVAEQNRLESGSESARKIFVFGERIDELIEYVNVNANPDEEYYAHADLLGSIMVLADSSGNIEESYRYKEFGETQIVDDTFTKLTTDISPVGNPYRYTGRRADIQLGDFGDDWYDYRARSYRPDIGRFVQRDPLKYVDSSNVYVYVTNSPIGLRDPFGLFGDGESALTTVGKLAARVGIAAAQVGNALFNHTPSKVGVAVGLLAADKALGGDMDTTSAVTDGIGLGPTGPIGVVVSTGGSIADVGGDIMDAAEKGTFGEAAGEAGEMVDEAMDEATEEMEQTGFLEWFTDGVNKLVDTVTDGNPLIKEGVFGSGGPMPPGGMTRP